MPDMSDPNKRAAYAKQSVFVAKILAFASIGAIPISLLSIPAAVGWAVACLAPAAISICRAIENTASWKN